VTPGETVAFLVRVGLEAVGCRIPVEFDGESLAVRDLLVEFEGGITCHSASDGTPREVFAMPLGAVESAASAVVARLLTGIATREIEAAHRRTRG